MSSSNTNDGGNSGVACTDDYYSYDTVSHFRDPGATLLIITVACCFLTVAIIPCVLRWGEQYDQYKNRRKAARKQRQETSSGGTTSDDIVVRYDGQSVLEQTLEGGGKQLKEKILGVSDASSDVSVSDVSLQAIPNWHNSKNKQKNDGDDDSVQSRKSSASSISAKSLASFIEDVVASSPRATHRRNKLAMTPADRVTTLRQYVQTELQLERGNSEEGEEGHIMVRSSSLNIRSDVPSLGTTINEKPTSIYSSDAFSVDQSDNETLDLRMCCGPSALWKPWVARQAFDKAVRLFEVDKDLKRLIGLAVPFTGRAFLAGVGYNLHWVFISRYLGTCELAAAAVVDIYQGVTTAFLGGMISAQISLSAQALGVGNNYLAGQYVQQAQILFTTFFIPAYIFWWFFVYPLTLRIGQPSNVAQIAQSYARVELINNWLLWLLNSIHGMYEVTDHEVFSSVSKIVTQYIYLAGLIPTLIYVENATLVTVAMLGIISNIMGIIWAITYPLYKGWLKSFIPGWLCSFSLSNISAVWHICRAGIPLGFGSLMAYCEWELNTIFVAHTGQAQVAAYALLGTLWETFESFTEGIGDAAVIRVALHLGQGDPRSAKISGYRSAILGLVVACLVTSIFWIFGHEIPQLFSTDPEVIKAMVASIPLMGIGNLSMTTGMVCWSVLGGQDRWNVATVWSFVCSFLVTIPLALLFSYKFEFGVQGIVSSLAIGYSLLGMILLCIVVRSDWAKISRNIQEENADSSDETINPSPNDLEVASVSSAKQSAGASPMASLSSTSRSTKPYIISTSLAPSDEIFTDEIELQAGFQNISTV